MRPRPLSSRRCWLQIGLALGLAPALSCAEPGVFLWDIPESELVAGLTLRGGDFAVSDDHLVELVVHEGYVYVANSNRGIAAMRLDEEGGLTTTDRGHEYDMAIRCTCLAVHAPSDTLYCGADDALSGTGFNLELYDISVPGAPRWREQFPIDRGSVRDLAVVEDQLILNQFSDGLFRAQIAEQSGALSELSDLGISGNARFSVPVSGRIVTLFADDGAGGAELRLYEASAPGWVELDRLALSGPALGLSADSKGGARVGVGLGSAGMAIVDVEDDALLLERVLEPPGVVTSGLLAGDLAYAVTLSGLFGYALEGEDARMFGFGPAAKLGRARAGNMLHGVMVDDEILTSDWLWVERWSAEPEGEVLELDVPRGIYLPPGGPVRWRVRNPGQQRLRVELWWDRESLWQATVEPEAELAIELSAAQRAQLLDAQARRVSLNVRVFDPEVPSKGEPVSSTALVLAERPANDLMPPALGDLFPSVTLINLEREVFTLPTPGGSQTIWFWPDCAMIWPQLEDLAWLEREGVELGRGTPVMLADFDVGGESVDGESFVERWALAGATFGMWGAAAPELGEANADLADYDIYEPLWIEELPGDAMPTDYVIDEEGVIRSIERMYRGPWTLVKPWPWE